MSREAVIEIDPKFLTRNSLEQILCSLPSDASIIEIRPGNSFYLPQQKSTILIESNKFLDIPNSQVIPKIITNFGINLDGSYSLTFFDMSNVLDPAQNIPTALPNVSSNPISSWKPYVSTKTWTFRTDEYPKLAPETLPPIHICSFTEFYRGFTDNYHYCACGKKQK